MIDTLKPDLLVTISRMRYENPELPRNVPALCWDQDNLQCMRDAATLDDLKGLTFVAGHGAVFGSMHLHWPLKACIFCHPAGMTHRYAAPPASSHDDPKFAADVSYLSHASGTPEQLRDNMALKWRGGGGVFIPLYHAACEQILAGARQGQTWEFLDLQALIRNLMPAASIPADVTNALLVDLRLLIDRCFRHQTLAWVADWCESRAKTLRLWGNGWETHPTLAKYAAGTAPPGDQAHRVFRASTINLQIIETGVLHSRMLDAWAAGAFVLIRQAHRPQDEARIQTVWRIAQLTSEENIESIADLESRGSSQLRALWQPLAPEFTAYASLPRFPGFPMWRSLPPAHVLIPALPNLMFNDASQFAALADQYINSHESRQKMLDHIHTALLTHLSYDARWRDFISHITANLP
jgi:hypothetical protein